MNAFKVNTIKFFMTVFENSCNTSEEVENFKRNLVSMKNRGQVDADIIDALYAIYGIQNTNVYRPTMQQDKLLQIKQLMYMCENNFSNNLITFKKFVLDGESKGGILESARKCIFMIYDLDDVDKSFKDMKKKATAGVVPPPVNKGVKTSGVSDEVLADRNVFKDEYLDKIVYKIDNGPGHYCTGESRYTYVSIMSVKEKPNNAVAVKYEDYVSDGCSGHTYYIEVPDYVYKKKPGRYTTNPVVTACSSTVTWNHC